MAFCAKCGKQLDPDAAFCPSCGTPVAGARSAASTPGTPISGIDSVIRQPAAQQYWLERIVAFVIDAIVVYVVLGILAAAFALPVFFIGGVAAMAAMIAGVFSFVAGIVLVAYFTLAESHSGTSLGKWAMGLVVRSKTGRNPTLVEAFTRNISKIYWLLLLLDVVVGLATTKEYTQKLSDRFAGTYVSKH